MPFTVVGECSPSGWRWLVAHEIGHIAVRNLRSDLLRWAFTGTSFIVLLCGLVLVILSAASAVAGTPEHENGPLVLVLAAAAVTFLCAGFALRRADESNADRFAVSYSGTVQGAEEYFAFLTNRRRQSTSSDRLAAPVLWPFRTHPTPADRLRIMCRELAG